MNLKRVLIPVLMLASLALGAQDYTHYVNTFQGTHNTPEFSHGRLQPIVCTPHSDNIWVASGFTYAEPKFNGITICGLNISTDPNATRKPVLDGKSTVGRPECLKMKLDNGTIFEVAPTANGGIMQVAFSKKGDASLEFRAAGEHQFQYDPKSRRLTGYIANENFNYVRTDNAYIVVELSQACISINNSDNKVKLTYKKGSKVTVKAAFSKINAEQAQLNFDREVAAKDFAGVRADAMATWNAALGRIAVEGGTEEQRKTFYSCLYHTMLRPARDFETNAEGKDFFSYNNEIHEGKYHTNPILWDAFRCLFALDNIIDTELQQEYLPSLIKGKEITGWWPTGHVMIGNHAISVLCDAWAKGIRCFDPAEVLRIYVDEITTEKLETDKNVAYNADHLRGFGRMGHEEYFTLGYISYPQDTDRVMETTAKTLEYNYDDFCAWKLAKMTGLKFYEDLFAKHIYNYRNMYDPSDGFFKGRDRNGVFDTDFNPYEWGGAFVEGNGWQWRFFVPQDPKGMIELMGGKEKFEANLDEVFTAPGDSVLCGGYGFMIHEITEAVAGGQGQYAQGNEPCFHVMHLYDYIGKPWKAQSWLRDSMERLFDSTEKGFPGDEDGGAMSAWYVFNAMGFYPVTPGVAEYAIGSPLFNKITISLENGGNFVILANGNGAGKPYIAKATLNGSQYDHNYITHEAIMNGGELVFDMSADPCYTRGTKDEDSPYSMTE